MRPLWECTLTWGVADHLRRGGVGSDAAAYSLASLIVRDLDRRYGLTTELARYSLATPEDVDDPEKTSPRYLSAVQHFWQSVGGKTGSLVERNRLIDLALASLLRGGSAESRAAAVLAQDARTIEATYGKLGSAFAPAPWSGLGNGSWATSGFGALRDEMALTGDATVLAAYDRLVSAARDRAAVVKLFQTWTRAAGRYAGRIDGVWGPLTESAFLLTVPMASGRVSELHDVVPLRGVFTGSAADAQAIAVLVTRDLWLDANPSKLTEEIPPAVEAEDGSSISVSYPKAEAATATSTPSGGSQIVVSYPKEDGESGPSRVTITLPATTATIVPVGSGGGLSHDLLVGGGLVLGGVAILGVAWWLSRRKPPLTLTEDTP